MAKLTDQLSTDMSIKPVREPPAPSTGLATGLNAISKAIDIFADTNKQNTANAVAKATAARQAKADTYKNQENRIPYETLLAERRAQDAAANSGGVDVNSPLRVNTDFSVFDRPSEGLPGDLQAYADSVASKLDNVKVSVEQGRLPAISYNAALNKEFMSLANRYPDHVDGITKYFGELGLKPSLARQGLDEQDQHAAVINDRQEWEKGAYKKGMESLNPEVSSTMSREDVIAAGAAASHTEYELEQVTKRASLAQTNQAISAAERKAIEGDTEDKITQTMVIDAYNQSGPMITALQSVMLSLDKADLPTQQAGFQELSVKYEQWTQSYRAQALARASASGLKGEKFTQLMSGIDTMIDRGKTMFSGDFSLAKANANALTAITTATKMKVAEAMPVYFALQSMGIGAAEIQAVSGGLQSNPALAEKLRKEMAGFSTEFGEEKASTHLMNVVKLLKGENTIQDYTPTQARMVMPTLYTAASRLATDYGRGSKDVPADTMLNSVGNIISAARTVGPGSGLETWTVATGGAAGRDTRRALIRASKDPVHNDMAEAVISGSRAASASILDAMKPAMATTNINGWSVKINKDGRAIALRNLVPVGGYDVNLKAGTSRVKMGLTTTAIPADISNYVKTFNTNLDNLVELNQHDPSGIKKATPLEIQKFYSQGIVSESMRSSSESISAKDEIDKNMSKLDSFFNNVPGMNEQIDNPGLVEKPRVMNYEARAAGFKAVPDSVETLGHASEFAKQVNKAGVASSAMGTYQIVGQTLREFAPKVFGEDWENVAFTPANQDKVAEAIFNERKSTAASLKSTWVSLSLADAERVRKMPWSQAKEIIARGESG